MFRCMPLFCCIREDATIQGEAPNVNFPPEDIDSIPHSGEDEDSSFDDGVKEPPPVTPAPRPKTLKSSKSRQKTPFPSKGFLNDDGDMLAPNSGYKTPGADRLTKLSNHPLRMTCGTVLSTADETSPVSLPLESKSTSPSSTSRMTDDDTLAGPLPADVCVDGGGAESPGSVSEYSGGSPGESIPSKGHGKVDTPRPPGKTTLIAQEELSERLEPKIMTPLLSGSIKSPAPTVGTEASSQHVEDDTHHESLEMTPKTSNLNNDSPMSTIYYEAVTTPTESIKAEDRAFPTPHFLNDLNLS